MTKTVCSILLSMAAILAGSRDAVRAEERSRNGKRGGNPALMKREDNLQVFPRGQKPEARTIEASHRADSFFWLQASGCCLLILSHSAFSSLGVTPLILGGATGDRICG